MVKVKSKKATKKISRRKLPVIQSAYERKHKIPGIIIMGFPGPLRTADTIHYLNKEGKLIHDSKMRTKSELKKLIMTKAEFNKRYGSSESKVKVVSKKLKKKNPSLENEIHDIERMKRMLLSWNLKYDVFPDVVLYVNKHWTQTYGKKEALDLLNAAMNQRSDLYWNVERLIPPGGTRAGKQLDKANTNWKKIVNRLNGIEEKEPENKDYERVNWVSPTHDYDKWDL